MLADARQVTDVDEEAETVLCPICLGTFESDVIERHASACGEDVAALPHADALPEEGDSQGDVVFVSSQPWARGVHGSGHHVPKAKCELCGRLMEIHNCSDLHFMNACSHVFCRPCASDALTEALTKDATITSKTLMCPAAGCDVAVACCDQNTLLNLAEQETLSTRGLEMFISHGEANGMLMTCPSCSVVFEAPMGTQEDAVAAVGTPDSNGKVTVDGDAMSVDAAVHRNRFRFRCRQCHTIFCGECKRTPYHNGYTCTEFSTYSVSRRCRFCDDVIQPSAKRSRTRLKSFFSNSTRDVDVCENPQCGNLYDGLCPETLSCGHTCYGSRGEKPCMSCLAPGCRNNTCGLNEEDYCIICYSDALRSAPCVQLACGHVFHTHCVMQKIQKQWPGARITFSFLNCPSCNAQMKSPLLMEALKPALVLYEDIQRKMSLRMAHEGLLSAPAVLNRDSKFYNNPLGYAETVLSYYSCFRCSKPYFGGFKRCEAIVDDEVGDFDKSELVCSSCVPNSDVRVCKLHGTEFIEFKCRFCCAVAQWFCWGTTHFCTSCHKQQELGNYLTKKKKEELPVCEGPNKCPVGGQHPPNGSEFSLGCVLCRNSVEGGF